MKSKYLCIHRRTDKLRDCKTCCGLTNICGFYENISGENPFYTRQLCVKKDGTNREKVTTLANNQHPADDNIMDDVAC